MFFEKYWRLLEHGRELKILDMKDGQEYNSW